MANDFTVVAVKRETHAMVCELAELTGRNKSRAVHMAIEAALRLARANAARRAERAA